MAASKNCSHASRYVCLVFQKCHMLDSCYFSCVCDNQFEKKKCVWWVDDH
jgi:hypothetical protein